MDGNDAECISKTETPFGRKSQKLINLQQPIIMSYENAATTDELAQEIGQPFEVTAFLFARRLL